MNQNIREIVLYSIIGVLTTLINYLIYYLLIQVKVNWLIANMIAWIVAVIFAYITNKDIVFKVTNNNALFMFIKVRLITLILENILLFIGIEKLLFNRNYTKIIVTIIIVIINYLYSKFKIFTRRFSDENH